MLGVVTRTGTGVDALATEVLLPSCLKAFEPQQNTAPLFWPQVWALPAAREAKLKPEIAFG